MTAQLRAFYLFLLLLAGSVQTNPKLEKVRMDCYKDVKGTIYEYDTHALNGKDHIPFKQYVGKHVLFVNVATYCGLTVQYPELNALQEELEPFGLVVLGFPCNQFGNQEPGENSEILPGLKDSLRGCWINRLSGTCKLTVPSAFPEGVCWYPETLSPPWVVRPGCTVHKQDHWNSWYVRPGGGYVPNFQLFEKGDVNGEKEQKVFTFLKHSCPHPSELLGSFRHISWEPIKVHDIRWNFEKFLVGPDGVPVMRWSHRAPVSTVKSDILEYLRQLRTK